VVALTIPVAEKARPRTIEVTNLSTQQVISATRE
jgi:hypothetical protein